MTHLSQQPVGAPKLRRKYRNAPIVEAVCEFRFQPGRQWDWALPGLVYARIKEEFPERQQESAFEVVVNPRQEGVVTQQVAGSLSKVQFVAKDKSAMVQIGPDLLAVNVYRPYRDWEHFETLIAHNLQIYEQEAKPSGFNRIGLRYINKFQFSSPVIELMDYFDYYPHIPSTVEQRHGAFAMRVMFLYSNDRDALNVRMGHAASEDTKNLAIALDLDYFLTKPAEVKLGEALNWVTEAHDRIERVFEACITDRARELCGIEETK